MANENNKNILLNFAKKLKQMVHAFIKFEIGFEREGFLSFAENMKNGNKSDLNGEGDF